MRVNLLFVAVLSSCGGHAPFKPVTVFVQPDAFAKATRVLVERGATIETKDEQAGLIVTRWEDSESMGTQRRLRWSLTFEKGTVTVTSQCSLKLSGTPAPGQTNGWEDCGNQPSSRNDEARVIADAIAK